MSQGQDDILNAYYAWTNGGVQNLAMVLKAPKTPAKDVIKPKE